MAAEHKRRGARRTVGWAPRSGRGVWHFQGRGSRGDCDRGMDGAAQSGTRRFDPAQRYFVNQALDELAAGADK